MSMSWWLWSFVCVPTTAGYAVGPQPSRICWPLDSSCKTFEQERKNEQEGGWGCGEWQMICRVRTGGVEAVEGH